MKPYSVGLAITLKALNDKADEIIDFLVLILTLAFVAKGLLLIGFVFFGGVTW